ncbi:MAG: hypothetical protein E7265_06170 [Lachnospiraceae bacterium]|nr:hypothetical protein [Lachnospiraceae bacterium]
MALHIVTGGAGAGKTYYMYEKILRQSVEENHRDYLIIVPEQFTMQTQKDIVMMSKAKGIMNIDVLSFMRLAYRVLEKTPALSKPVLEDEGKGMIIRRILKEHQEEWTTFGGNIKRPGFVEEIKSIITEFLQYRVDDRMLDNLGENISERPMLSHKLNDLQLVYKYYKEYMEERYISAEELLELLVKYSEESELLRDSIVCIDGFTGLTPVQYVFLGKLLNVCKEVYITVTIEDDIPLVGKSEPFELFHMSKSYIDKICRAADDNGVEIVIERISETNNTTDNLPDTQSETGEEISGANKKRFVPHRFINNPVLAKLQKNIFRVATKYDTCEISGNAAADCSCAENPDDYPISVYEASNPYEEAEYIAWQIRNLVKDKGLRYRDIAVVSGDVSLYGQLLEQEFERADIPAFIDNTKSVISNSFVDMIRSLLKLAEGRFLYEDVIHFLRNGLVRDYLNFGSEDTDILENFLIARGIRGKKNWNKVWNSAKHDEDVMLAINEYRERVTAVLMPYVCKMEECSCIEDYCRVLYEFLVEYEFSSILEAKASGYDACGMPIEKKEYEQIYRIVINLLDQTATLMGDEVTSVNDFSALLTVGFMEGTVGVIPPGIDCVIVGDTERTRLKDIKVLFFAGVNDGIVPKAVKQGGFLTDMERDYLQSKGAELAPTLRERVFNERFYLYLTVTKPMDFLYLSYSRKQCGGEELEPSSFIAQISDAVGKLPVTREFKKCCEQGFLSNDEGKDWWISGLRKAVSSSDEFYRDNYGDVEGMVDKKWLELHRHWMGTEEGKEIFDSAFYVGGKSSISRKIASLLYGDVLVGSVSRFEQFAKCRFAHFLKYGLHLNNRPEYIIDVPDIGILFHGVVEGFSKRLSDNNKRWQDTDDILIREWTREITDAICTEYGNSIMQDNARNEYMKERIFRISERTIKTLAKHMKSGAFEASGYELSFLRLGTSDMINMRLDDGHVMHLTGRIDRLDVCEQGDNVYIKIIDYKTGNKSYSLKDVYYGLDMQLVVYIQTAKEVMGSKYKEKVVIPAGAFYFHIDDPEVEIGENDDIDKKIYKEYQMNGLLSNTLPIPYLIDMGLGNETEGLIPGATSDIIKVAVARSGSYDNRTTSAISDKQFDYLGAYVQEKMRQFGNEIYEGHTDINPYRFGKECGCDYCEYSSVCGFDVRLEGDCYNKLNKVKEAEIWEEMKQAYERKNEE